MKNKENFQKELAEIALHRDSVALINGKPVSCMNTQCEKCDFCNYHCEDNLAEWAESEYKEPLLDDKERAFLQYLVDHIRPRIVYIKKHGYEIASKFADKEYISFGCINEYKNICKVYLPDFDKGTMYKNLELNKEYTPAELGFKVKE
jgi:hypothetical protein